MIDKSKDYLVQNSTKTAYVMHKPSEGSPAYNTNSIADFKDGAKTVEYTLKQTVDRTSPDWTQNDNVVIYIWRTPWLAAGFTDEPLLSDKILVDNQFYLVNNVGYTDYDDSGYYQRYVLHCTGSNRPAVA